VLREERAWRRRGGDHHHGLGGGRVGGCGVGRGRARRRRREAERAAVAGRDAARGQGRGDSGAVIGGGQPLDEDPTRPPRRHRVVARDLGVHAAPVLPPPLLAAFPGHALGCF
jgi:hypothetical protein